MILTKIVYRALTENSLEPVRTYQIHNHQFCRQIFLTVMAELSEIHCLLNTLEVMFHCFLPSLSFASLSIDLVIEVDYVDHAIDMYQQDMMVGTSEEDEKKTNR